MAAEIRVNGVTYKRFKQIDISRGIDTFAGEVRILVSQAQNNNSIIKVQDLVEIFFDGIQVFSGYIEKINDTEDRRNHDISYRARDTVSDLIDSEVPDNVMTVENVRTMKDLVQLCIDGRGLTDIISVIDNVGVSFSDTEEFKAAEQGQTIGDFLEDNARQVQIFLNTDGKGNVVINRPSGKLKTLLKNVPGDVNNNIKNSSFEIDYSQRFNKYTVYSNSSLASDSATINDINNKGEAFDSEIRKSRTWSKIAENPMTSKQCKAEAEEEANIRRARSFSYSCEVAGFSANGELWEPGKGVTVKDVTKGISGSFQTNKITWTFGGGGELTKIDVTLPDKLTVEAQPTVQIERESLPSSTYGIKQGDTLSQIALNFGVKLSELVQANPQIENPDLIFPDQQIQIPVTEGA